ncbi:hypothetical protein [Variovorax arabinosiphilus]|uniref:hypothetical protein n=1 Tax=Variovorax arabinosiphilus TaxID=3053498 RepID=UPI00257504C7|nr:MULTISPECIES: hypothetical protein [unclassified Variovorax]MDM0118918.1 hypothetical protein [Variovorax sp. J2L1-78]MDM0129344.1 hypothetical protein [Variovorax sp. J2L1-63]MDM0232870.1 hypothetical protein [Variovorax sp. J2R1-6]
MTITEFLKSIGFKSHGSVVNSWDAFAPSGTVLMQLWSEAGQRVREHANAGAYLRVRCFHAEGFAETGAARAVGYSGRRRAIDAVARGALGYVVLSAPPAGLRGPGVWAKHADLSRAYPVLEVEAADADGDIYVILGQPVPVATIDERRAA